MEPLSALAAGLAAITFPFGGVVVTVTGSNLTVLPAQPDPAHMDLVAPTSQVAMYTSILMTDGSRWQVPRVPRRLSNGSVSFTLKPPTSSAVTTFVVAQVDLETPIWVVGEIEQSPGGENPVDPNETPQPVPTFPGVPTTPPVEPPTEG